MPRVEPDRFERIENRLLGDEGQLRLLQTEIKLLSESFVVSSLLPDWKIKEYAIKKGMITPFVDRIIREEKGRKIISKGLSSYGFDFTLSPDDFRIFRHIPGKVVNPKDFDPDFLEQANLHEDEYGKYFILPGNSYALGVTVEYLQIPSNVTVVFIGKSTYARCGVIVNVTPGEAGFKGTITLEFSNASNSDVRIYVNEGVVQGLFFMSENCEVTYADRKGKYQNQGSHVTLPRI